MTVEPMPYCVQASIKASGLIVVVVTAREALAKMAELIEIGLTEVRTLDLDGRVVIDNASLEAEAAATRSPLWDLAAERPCRD
jgi:hypothetical protein